MSVNSPNTMPLDKLVAFVYLLVRDYVPAGQIGTILAQMKDWQGPITFSNKFLEEYAKDVVERLINEN